MLLVARPSIEFSVSSIRLDHSRLYAFVDRQESYVLLSSPGVNLVPRFFNSMFRTKRVKLKLFYVVRESFF